MPTEKSYTVETHSSNVLSKLNRQRSDETFCDVILKVEGKKFYAHRNVLSACSEYFYKMFTTNMKEKYDKTVTFKDITADAMNAILDFLYTETIVLTEENVSDILHAASIMQIPDALNVVVSYLSESLDSGNCLYFRKVGHLHSLPKLVAETDQYILNHFEEISQQDTFFDLDASEVEMLFASDKLKVAEEKLVFETMEKWVNKDLRKRKCEFPKIFSNLRLQFVPVQYVAAKVRKDKLVREFPDCRDLVEDAFFFHISPEMVVAEEPRESYKPEANAVMFVSPNMAKPSIFDVTKKTWINEDFDGWAQNLVKPSSAVTTNSPKSVFCGGLGNGGQISNEVIQFDGKNWAPLPAMNVARCGAAAVYWNGDLYVFGGEKVSIPTATLYYNYQENSQKRTDFADDFEKFSNETWEIEGELPNQRSYAVAEVLEDKVYVIAGYMYNEICAVPNYDPTYGVQVGCKEGTLQYVEYIPVFRRSPLIRKIEVKIGPNATRTVDVYDLKTRKWSSGSSLKVARADFGSAVVRSTIYVLGGWGSNRGCISGAEFFDLETGVWTSVATKCPYALSTTSACKVEDQIYLVSQNYKYLMRFDPAPQQWVQEQGAVSPGSFVTSFVLSDQKEKK